MGLTKKIRPISSLYVTYITYYLLSHKDNNIISTNNPVTPPVKNEPTRAEILVITSIPNQPDPKITVDRIETDTNDTNTPLIPPNTSPIVANILFTFMIFPPTIYLLIRMNNLL